MKTLHETCFGVEVGVGGLVSLLSEGECKLGLRAGGWAALLSSSVYPRIIIEGK